MVACWLIQLGSCKVYLAILPIDLFIFAKDLRTHLFMLKRKWNHRNVAMLRRGKRAPVPISAFCDVQNIEAKPATNSRFLVCVSLCFSVFLCSWPFRFSSSESRLRRRTRWACPSQASWSRTASLGATRRNDTRT